MSGEKAPGLTSRQARDIADAVRGLEVSTTEAWSDLDLLSSHTHVEAVEVFEDEIRLSGTHFEGPVNVHVTLQYSDDVTWSETFPGRFNGSLNGSEILIEGLQVDTSSFTG